MCSKGCRRVYGFILLSVIVAFAIIGLVASGVTKDYVTVSFKSNQWNAVAGVAIGAATYLLFITLFGYLTFICPNKWIIFFVYF